MSITSTNKHGYVKRNTIYYLKQLLADSETINNRDSAQFYTTEPPVSEQ